MTLEEELAAARAAAEGFASEGEALEGIVPTEPGGRGERVYLCAYGRDGERSWLALDARGRPVAERVVVREAASIAALCEVAEESAGGGDIGELRARLVELRLLENPEGIEEAEAAAAALHETVARPPRVASLPYLDAVGVAAQKLERALGDDGASPFAAAMTSGAGAAEELATEIVSRHKTPLA
jgi:hypothetical protein